ncbi:MAG: class I SAM-dependent methyltransferase [Candidatus Lokiarchaeota archaeon]|nr:class I SAM-dependent methyltransferase [Candidatus Lokiarchaeota archaeon]
MIATSHQHVDAHGRLFNRIAAPYQWFFQSQVKYYTTAIAKLPIPLPIPPRSRVLDIGCGTGALAKTLQQMGHVVSGVDIAPRMAALAWRNGIDCIVGDVVKGLPFKDCEFDMVTCAFFIHGIPEAERSRALEEASRVSQHGLFIIDYNTSTSHPAWYVRSVEAIEGGDYIGFMRTGLSELQGAFHRVEIHEASKTTAFYLCSVPR